MAIAQNRPWSNFLVKEKIYILAFYCIGLAITNAYMHLDSIQENTLLSLKVYDNISVSR